MLRNSAVTWRKVSIEAMPQHSCSLLQQGSLISFYRTLRMLAKMRCTRHFEISLAKYHSQLNSTHFLYFLLL